jgi:hypothetical protein
MMRTENIGRAKLHPDIDLEVMGEGTGSDQPPFSVWLSTTEGDTKMTPEQARTLATKLLELASIAEKKIIALL